MTSFISQAAPIKKPADAKMKKHIQQTAKASHSLHLNSVACGWRHSTTAETINQPFAGRKLFLPVFLIAFLHRGWSVLCIQRPQVRSHQCTLVALDHQPANTYWFGSTSQHMYCIINLSTHELHWTTYLSTWGLKTWLFFLLQDLKMFAKYICIYAHTHTQTHTHTHTYTHPWRQTHLKLPVGVHIHTLTIHILILAHTTRDGNRESQKAWKWGSRGATESTWWVMPLVGVRGLCSLKLMAFSKSKVWKTLLPDTLFCFKQPLTKYP